ncbi:unnamed protein product [Rotaria magnacalcarata]|uniref:Nuclear receptor domain-containing protein n=1 Tax=Rotaria magnacalcarata TaxID=392030 RepID=A0A816SET9_9BILA|nr:unnamed protein product [Rotaria magnacalcarata]CAF4020608.1 unnamed protein product [Rotaria magnacalcarata]
MNCDNQSSKKHEPLNKMNNPTSVALCHVCGIEHAQVHYGAMCCVSCKMFFRRNAQLNLSNRKCATNGKCNITIKSRKTCRYCRLKKCFTIGMQRELLRASHNRQGTRCKSTPKENVVRSTITVYPLDLLQNDRLQNDRSLLKNEQWTCLSNVIHLFDEKFSVPQMRDLLNAQYVFPMKIRMKMAPTNMLTLLSAMYQGVYPFATNITHFTTLPLNDRSTLIERNMRNIGGYSGIILSRDADVHSSPIFKIGFPEIYGTQVTDDAIKIYKNTDQDNTLVKLLIPALIFSTGSDLLLPKIESKCDHFGNSCHLLSNEKQVLEMQNFYVEILFKYMIFRYGFKEAVIRFAALIKTSLDQSMCSLNGREVRKHQQLMETIVEQTEHSMAPQNEIVLY